MNRLPDLLEDLAAADTVSDTLRRLAASDPRDPILGINLGAVARRRRDLERQLSTLLATEQRDLIRYRLVSHDGSTASALAVARSVLLFQTLVTSVFDAIRTTPKRLYQPSAESVRLSALYLASASDGRHALHFTIPNDRLLILESDLDETFALVFELLTARAKTAIRDLASRAGIASVAAAHSWAENAVQHGLVTTIGWRKSGAERRTASLTHSDALLFKTAVEAVNDSTVEQVECDCELMALDEAAATFRIESTGGEAIAGTLGAGFPRGRSWTTRHWYCASLEREARVRYATGEEIVRWSLRGLIPQD